MQYFTNGFIDFFKDLAANNNKIWFDLHKNEYEQDVKLPFYKFVQDLLSEISIDIPNIEKDAKNAIFKIYRNLRFSKDKTPYKLYTSALLSEKGRKDIDYPGFYIEFGPEFIFIFGGLYNPNTQQIYKVRNHIMNQLSLFQSISKSKDFCAKFDTIKGEKQKRIPSEFNNAIAKEPLILNKQWYIEAKLPSEVLLSEDILSMVATYIKTALPLNRFIVEALHN